jgi:fumarate reductase subunit D
MNREPIRSVVAVLVAVIGLLQVLGVIDADTAANIVGLITLVVGGEVARARVTPVG